MTSNLYVYTLRRRPVGTVIWVLWWSIALVNAFFPLDPNRFMGSSATSLLLALIGAFSFPMWWCWGVREDVKFLRTWLELGFTLAELPRAEQDRIMLRPRAEMILAKSALRASVAGALRDAARKKLGKLTSDIYAAAKDAVSFKMLEAHDVTLAESLSEATRIFETREACTEAETRSFLKLWDFFQAKTSFEGNRLHHHPILNAQLHRFFVIRHHVLFG